VDELLVGAPIHLEYLPELGAVALVGRVDRAFDVASLTQAQPLDGVGRQEDIGGFRGVMTLGRSEKAESLLGNLKIPLVDDGLPIGSQLGPRWPLAALAALAAARPLWVLWILRPLGCRGIAWCRRRGGTGRLSLRRPRGCCGTGSRCALRRLALESRDRRHRAGGSGCCRRTG
jgi:hypothetical protein